MDDTKLTEKEIAKEALEKIDIQNVMGSDSGRRFVWRILEYCGIYRDIDGENIDVYKALGNRQAGLYILGIVSDVCEEQLFLMMKEARNKKLLEERDYDYSEYGTSGNNTSTSGSGHTSASDALDLDGYFDSGRAFDIDTVI